MAAKTPLNTNEIVRWTVDTLVGKESYAFATGALQSDLIDAIELLPKAKREAFLECMARQTEKLALR